MDDRLSVIFWWCCCHILISSPSNGSCCGLMIYGRSLLDLPELRATSMMNERAGELTSKIPTLSGKRAK